MIYGAGGCQCYIRQVKRTFTQVFEVRMWAIPWTRGFICRGMLVRWFYGITENLTAICDTFKQTANKGYGRIAPDGRFAGIVEHLVKQSFSPISASNLWDMWMVHSLISRDPRYHCFVMLSNCGRMLFLDPSVANSQASSGLVIRAAAAYCRLLVCSRPCKVPLTFLIKCTYTGKLNHPYIFSVTVLTYTLWV